MPQRFDIVYAPVVLAPPVTVHVITRGVEGVDRTHALLSWLRSEIGLKVDPVEMFEDDYEHEAACGCEFYVTFRMEEKRGRIATLLGHEPAGLRAEIECTPCEEHEQTDFAAPERDHRDWNGAFTAVGHDPKRKESYEAR